MQQLTTLTDDADQLVTVVLPDQSIATFEFIYRPATQRWTFNVGHVKLTGHGWNLCAGPNLLRPWRNLIPFGLAVVSTDQGDPFQIGDFVSGRITVYVLSAAEVLEAEATYFQPVPLVNP